MSLCALCGRELEPQLNSDTGIHPHHHGANGDGWSAAGNRIMCDFFHRKKVPPQLDAKDHDGKFAAHIGESA